MRGGGQAAPPHVAGRPEEVLTEENVRQVFGLESRIITDPTSGRPTMLPIGRHRMIAKDRTRPQEDGIRS